MKNSNNSERKVLVSIHYDTATGANGMASKNFSNNTDAANWIIAFAKENPEYIINTDTNIRDFDAHKKYTLTDADINAINAETAAAEASATEVDAEIELATATEQEENTMTTRDRYLAAKEVASVRHNFDNDRDEWYINGKRTNKKNAATMLKNYNLTLDTFKTEHEAYINEQLAKGARQMAIDDQAEHVSDKVSREVKPCDDNDNVLALLPELDELNDVSDIAPVIQSLRQTFAFTPVGDEQHQILTSGDVVTFLNGKLHHITSTKYAAWFSAYFCHYAWHIFKDGKIDGVNGTNDAEEFFAEMVKRGACTIDESEPPPVDDYDIKRQKRFARNQLLRKWNAELADLKAGLSKMSGKHQKRGVLGTYKLEFGLYVTTTNDECKYLLKVASLPIGIYDTPAQVEAVINRIREAIERGDKEFKFPTIDELNQPPIDTDKPADEFGVKLAELQAKRDAAQAALLKAQEEHEAAENTLQKFLSDTAGDLATKLQSLKLDYSIKLIKKGCWTFSTTNFDDVYISAYRGGYGVKFHFETWNGRTLAKYDTPAQVEQVIDMLRAAIKNGETKFTLPTVDELITTRKAA